MMRRIPIVAMLVIGGVLASAPAEAAKCSVSATSIVFGTYNVFSPAPVDSAGSLLFNCSGAKTVSIAITRGQSSTFVPRTLTKGGEALTYNLFLDAGRSAIWGDGTGGTQTYITNNPPNNGDVTVTIYGRIPQSQDISAGAYADTVSVVINF